MSDIDLRRQLLDFFHVNCHNDVKLIDICRAVQQPKKVVNSVLYCLRNEGILQKVVESPPVWRVSDKLYDKFKQSSASVEPLALQYNLKDDCAMSPIARNNNIVLSSVENNRADPMYVKEQLVSYNAVGNGSATEDVCRTFNGRFTSPQQMTVESSVGQHMANTPCLSKPAEAILNILHKQKGPLSCKAMCSLLGFPEAVVRSTLNQLLLLGLVYQDSYSMFWSVINKSNIQPQEDIVFNIISYLKRAKTAVHTKELVKGVGLNNKKEINPLLYKLQQKGVVIKVNESPPMWQLGEQLIQTLAEQSKESESNQTQDNQSFASNPLAAYVGGSERLMSLAPLLNNHLFHLKKDPTPIVEHPPEENANDAEAEKPVIVNNGPKEKLKRKYRDITEIVEKPSTLALPQDIVKLMNSLQPPSHNKSAETKASKATSGSQSQTSETDSTATANESRSAQNSKSSSENTSKGNTGRKLATSAKNASKSCESNSAAHYVNDVLNSDSFAALMKNPVSALYEYGQRNHIDTKVEITLSEGPPHNPRFKAVAYMGEEELAAAWDKTKKDARRQAAELAVRGLVANGGFGKFNSLPTNGETPNELPPVVSQFDMIAALSHKTFNERVLQVPEYMGGRKVLAALVMKNGESDSRGTVICLGTGNRCITGEGLSQDGLVVNDSHAEVITRRGFLRFLYKQLKTFEHGQKHSIFEPVEGENRLKIKPDVTFHLYISTAPCGDGALFTHNLKPGEKVEPPDSNDSVHHPVFTKSLQGLLRSKMEAGEGTIPIDTQYRFQSWDAILRGEKLRTMSCSDKIARWNVLGLQGALLSHVMKPVFLSSITLGNLYHHGHLSRAVCCRLVGEPDMNELLPNDYRLNHPDLGRVIVCTPSRETEKTKPHSINWCYEDERPELTSGVNGTSDERAGGQTQSRLCKAVIFQSFKEVATKFGIEHLSSLTYGEAKRAAKDFQTAKEVLFARFQQLGRGTWIRKPEEEEEFM